MSCFNLEEDNDWVFFKRTECLPHMRATDVNTDVNSYTFLCVCVLCRIQFYFFHVCSCAESLVSEIHQDLPDNLESAQSVFGN